MALGRSTAAIFGPIVCLLAGAVGLYVVVLSGNYLSGEPHCVDGYWCPSGSLRALITVPLGAIGLAGVGALLRSGVGLTRYGWREAYEWRRWIATGAIAGAVVVFAWFVAAMYYAGRIGAFS